MFARSLKPSRIPVSMTASRSSSAMKNGRRTISIGSETGLVSSFYLPQDPKDQEGVELLLGIATIVSKEIASSDKKLFDDGNGDDFLTRDKNSFAEPSVIFDQALTRGPSDYPSSLIEDDDFSWHRVRSVSIDGSPRRSSNVGPTRRTIKTKPICLPVVVTPLGTRLRLVRKPSVKILANKGKKEQTKFPKLTAQQTHNNNLPNIMHQHKRKATEQCTATGKSMTVIHRKKFSWKNYPGESCEETCDDRCRLNISSTLCSQLRFPLLSFRFVSNRTRSIFGGQSRRVFAPLRSELYNPAEEIQQSFDRATSRSGSWTPLRLQRRRVQLCHRARSHSLFLQELCPIIEKARHSPWLCSTQSWNSYSSRSPKICKKRRYHCNPSQALERQTTQDLRWELWTPKIQTRDYACVGINEGIFACLLRTRGSNQPNKKGRKKDDTLDGPLLHKMICVLYKNWQWCVTAMRSNLNQVSANIGLQLSHSSWGALLSSFKIKKEWRTISSILSLDSLWSVKHLTFMHNILTIVV